MNSRPRIPAGLIVGWLVILVAIVAVAMLAFPGDVSSRLWLRVAFIEVLSLSVWGSGAIYLLAFRSGGDAVRRVGGIAPAFILLIGGYALLSLLCFVVQKFAVSGGLTDRGIWIFQIIRTSIAALLVILLATARSGASAGLAFDHELAMTPRQLHDLLTESEPAGRGEDSSQVRNGIRRVKQAVLYSLNSSSALSQGQEYQALSRDIKKFCSDITELNAGSKDTGDRGASFDEKADVLVVRVKSIAAQSVVR